MEKLYRIVDNKDNYQYFFAQNHNCNLNWQELLKVEFELVKVDVETGGLGRICTMRPVGKYSHLQQFTHFFHRYEEIKSDSINYDNIDKRVSALEDKVNKISSKIFVGNTTYPSRYDYSEEKMLLELMSNFVYPKQYVVPEHLVFPVNVENNESPFPMLIEFESVHEEQRPFNGTLSFYVQRLINKKEQLPSFPFRVVGINVKNNDNVITTKIEYPGYVCYKNSKNEILNFYSLYLCRSMRIGSKFEYKYMIIGGKDIFEITGIEFNEELKSIIVWAKNLSRNETRSSRFIMKDCFERITLLEY